MNKNMLQEAIADAVDESIRAHDTGAYFDAVYIRRDGSVGVTSTERAETMRLQTSQGIGEVVGTWTGWDDYEAEEEIPAEARETAIDALYGQWSEAQD